MALASRPRVILLDEPTSGMGIDDIEEMKELIRDLGRDHTVLFIEHKYGHRHEHLGPGDVMRLGRKLVEGTLRRPSSATTPRCNAPIWAT